MTSLVQTMLFLAAGLCITVLISYAVGRRVGVRQGRAKHKALAPIELRAQAYESGRCPVCGTAAEERGTMCQKG
ncbi:hypothetical protein JI721_17020 [Alicyclobacillus cycloheptanicus]|jgi:hypothetical protein|uniref:FeoB-associated Cys-rich membrane protein n=1 Tax=Alicyclobacillus cycloheptanicus TaxID=1457 RepID=A0ABT9XH05_9BACL|nr:hypothetical protein [Alicyclobacillus cycloheptanicus]MDQ0189319.1 hypothetical protein [Alicyclobacillus cycloheptanicus]WDM01321.1 hypothetical protein JI721_17020 [Alicyclobacillus cycloheptanicus]